MAFTNSGYWGKGKTIAEAMNNANVTFKNEILIESFVKKDGSAFTKEEYDEITVSHDSVQYPLTSQRIRFGSLILRELECVNKIDSIAEEFLNICDEKKMDYNNIQKIEKALESIGVSV